MFENKLNIYLLSFFENKIYILRVFENKLYILNLKVYVYYFIITSYSGSLYPEYLLAHVFSILFYFSLPGEFPDTHFEQKLTKISSCTWKKLFIYLFKRNIIFHLHVTSLEILFSKYFDFCFLNKQWINKIHVIDANCQNKVTIQS